MTESGLNYNAPSSIRAFLDTHGLSMQKKFGQNFLINEGARGRIVEALGVGAGDAVWEIGPGLGSMTRLLLDRGAEVKVFEIDHGFIGALNDLFAKEIAAKQLVIAAGDVLKTWPSHAAEAGERPLYLLGNLPYNIAGMLLADFIENGRFFSRAVVTVQKEVAVRIMAQSGDRDYASLAVLFAEVYETRKICAMKGPFFYPPPNVDSTAFCFFPKEHAAPAVPPVFFPLVRALFAQKRKTVYNNLCRFAGNSVLSGVLCDDVPAFCETALFECAIEKNTRAENLKPADFRNLAAFLTKHGHGFRGGF
ncbi:MAG: 16S rRNA (adenine(1518)-N(6)/adenine(1519)-N(6))-dimethyltransferase RsmA [Spirochaetaceae bacterium]|nr:16S rRNA (adenine(1518)-N(6)/adenine(1519)-N(6))-dimethyltransferase RsmA [Spirochaetaceae bacterium]